MSSPEYEYLLNKSGEYLVVKYSSLVKILVGV